MKQRDLFSPDAATAGEADIHSTFIVSKNENKNSTWRRTLQSSVYSCLEFSSWLLLDSWLSGHRIQIALPIPLQCSVMKRGDDKSLISPEAWERTDTCTWLSYLSVDRNSRLHCINFRKKLKDMRKISRN